MLLTFLRKLHSIKKVLQQQLLGTHFTWTWISKITAACTYLELLRLE